MIPVVVFRSFNKCYAYFDYFQASHVEVCDHLMNAMTPRTIKVCKVSIPGSCYALKIKKKIHFKTLKDKLLRKIIMS